MSSKSSCTVLLLVPAILAFSGCSTTERATAIETKPVSSASIPYAGVKVKVALGKFENRSPFMRGIFSDGVDRLGNQARTILISHLNQSGRFGVMDRENIEEANREAGYKDTKLATKGADYLVIGDVTEFGRKEVGDKQFFGVLGRGREQIAYSKVTVGGGIFSSRCW
jgi:curli biogenesis system outer membrane secretion channel CsgG